MMSIKSRTTNTGPMGATMSPMTVDLVGPKGVFGKLDLPEIKTQSSGTDVIVPDQLIKIVDMEAFHAFVKAIMLDESLVLKLDNGVGTIKAMMMKSNIVYRKEVQLKGMNGPKVTLVKTEPKGDGFVNTTKIENPSPLDLDLGVITFDLLNAEGQKIGQMEGPLSIPLGESTATMEGKPVKGAGAKVGVGRMVGSGAPDGSWFNETIKFQDMPIELNETLVSLV
ncbi:hypothetical protein K402DRAFT_394594 [Aulographum hederae CBS 113979]|uniref:Uncharacterized protein n=1 Tax=Aulographum hederae CBS 113979 TaxID=1176131 RepID=A0A6G1GXS1_9PEZI|nr:hypothetical protein K402DRAFT_394594 [Aulographum hederae CBS 113979]